MRLCLSGRRGNVTCIAKHSPSGWIGRGRPVGFALSATDRARREHQWGWHPTKNRSVEQLNSAPPSFCFKANRTYKDKDWICSSRSPVLCVSASVFHTKTVTSSKRLGQNFYCDFWICLQPSIYNMSGNGANGNDPAINSKSSRSPVSPYWFSLPAFSF